MENRECFIENILKSQNNNAFFRCIFDFYAKNVQERHTFYECLAELHNQKKINLFREYSRLVLHHSTENIFWVSRYIFEETLILLDICSITECLDCLEHLILQAKNDGASHTPVMKFKLKLEKDPNLLEPSLNAFVNTPEKYKNFLSPIVTVGVQVNFEKFFDITLKFLGSEDHDLKSKAIYILGNLIYPSEALLKRTLEKLRNLSESEDDDEILANTVHSYISLILKTTVESNHHATDFLKTICNRCGPKTFHSLAQILFKEKHISPRVVPANLQKTKIICQTLQTSADIYPETYKLIARSFPTDVQFTEEIKLYLALIEFHIERGIEPQAFELENCISGNSSLTAMIITRWLSINSSRIPLAVAQFFYIDRKKLIKPDFGLVDTDQMPPKDFVARKAFSCLLQCPGPLLYFLLHLMEVSTPEEASEIADSIIYRILLNYPIQVENIKNWIKDLTSQNQEELSKILSKIEVYLGDIHTIPEIRELSPPFENIAAHLRKEQQAIGQVVESGRQQSLVGRLQLNRATLLFGKKAIFEVVVDQQVSYKEVELETLSSQVELPRMLLIDKDAFEYELICCLLEKHTDETNLEGVPFPTKREG